MKAKKSVTPEHWHRIEELYNSALEFQESERQAYLNNACRSDEGLRKEVESLLSHGKTTAGWLKIEALRDMVEEIFGKGEDEQSLVGMQLGSYEVLSPIAAGGMGEVYEARDTKLGRYVALKVLPSTFVHEPERLARFQREARLLASLNHPNIATIYGLEQSNGIHFLIMELVSGETLAARVNAGQLGLEEALQIGVQVAEALEAAHEKGIVHRDLKPANVKVTPEGRAKVLDFGIAKAFVVPSGLEVSNAASLTAIGTGEGKILGTPGYMSPEQARGKPVDKRTDIWAFGCLCYELLAGKPAFRAETIGDTLAKVLERGVDWEALPVATPVKVQELLHRCLEKDPNRRLRDIGDARIELVAALAGTPSEGISHGKRFKMTRRAAIGALAGAAAGAAATSAWYFWPSAAKPLMRLNMNVSPAEQFAQFT